MYFIRRDALSVSLIEALKHVDDMFGALLLGSWGDGFNHRVCGFYGIVVPVLL